MSAGRYEFVKDRVSIVTPVFDVERYLPGMLDSILSQTWQKVEMILVDDGSADNTVEVAESYRGRFAAKGYEYHIIRAAHKNASAAINQGLPHVTGEYLIWPDSDDILEPSSIEERVGFLQRNLQYQCVRTLAYYFDAETGSTKKADEKTGDLTKEELFWDILEFKTFVCCGCYMLRTQPFFEIYPDRRIPEYDVGQNFQMLLPFMFHHKCPTIQKKLYGVCVREGSHSRRILTQEQDKKKYHDYELLVDEISEICGLKDRKSLRRIKAWKIRRRYQIACKYGYLKMLVSCFLFCVNTLRERERRFYNSRRRSRLKNTDFTIIASNCSGTIMYYDLGEPFLSPTINLTVEMNDFVKMVENLEWYMEQEIVEEKEEECCPAGVLGDVRIRFVHYATFAEGSRKWSERKKRIRWDNLFIVGVERDGCTYETIRRFDQLPYKNKVIFTHAEYPEISSAVYIKGFEGEKELGTITNYKKQFWKRRYLDDFDYVHFLNGMGTVREG